MQPATTTAALQSAGNGAPAVSASLKRAVARWLIPSFPDCLFMALMVWLFMAGAGWKVLLGDADTGWHIRTGEYILDSRTIPSADLFSFTRAGEPWYAWEWLAGVIFALLHRAWGLKGVVLLSGTVLALAFTTVYRHALWRKSNGALALAVTLMAASASTIHFLARPHVFSLLLVPLTLWLIDRDVDRPGRAVWWLVPLAALWTNLHGGFVALLISLGACAAAQALAARWTMARRYAALTALCSLATLVNPFGWKLHAHIAAYLGSSWIRDAVEEFQSPRFRSESMAQFEVLLFAGIAVAALLLGRREWYGALLIGMWAHAALGSARHIPIYALAAAPLVASELSRLWTRLSAGWRPGTLPAIIRDVALDFGSGPKRASVWAPVLVIALVLANPAGWWPVDFPDVKLPVKLVNRNLNRFTDGSMARILAPDQWGDYLIYRFHPRQKVFIDGRSDFYGPEIGKHYVRMINGHYQWRALMDRYGFDAALIPPVWPLAELLKREAGWQLVEDDGSALLFIRRHSGGLNKRERSAEGTAGGQNA